MPRAKTASQNGQPDEPVTPTALEQPQTFPIEPLTGQEIDLFHRMLQGGTFPSPEDKREAFTLQVKVIRAVQAVQEANA